MVDPQIRLTASSTAVALAVDEAVLMTSQERRAAERRRCRTREHRDRIDAHLRAWFGVDFALLGEDLCVDEVVLRARAVQLGLAVRRI